MDYNTALGENLMEATSKKFKLFLIIFIGFVYIGLPLTILIGIISFDYKFYALTIGAFFVYILLRIVRSSNSGLGITKKRPKKSIIHILPFTVILAIVGLAIWISGYSRITPNEQWSFFVFYVFISCPIQEFLYRGSLEAMLDKLRLSYIARMLISSLLYSFVHIIYRDIITLLLTFIIGLIWFFCYQKTKNLLGVSLSHAVLGVVTIVAGIID